MWTPPLLTYRTSEPVIGPPRTPPFAGPAACIVSPRRQAVYPAASSPQTNGRPRVRRCSEVVCTPRGEPTLWPRLRCSDPTPCGWRPSCWRSPGRTNEAAQRPQYELEPRSRIANEWHQALPAPSHLTTVLQCSTSIHTAMQALGITLDREPPALRSTRNHPRTAVRPGAAWPPAERPSSWLVVRGGSPALAGGPAPSRHGCQAPQKLSTGTRFVGPARGRWAWPRRCGRQPCLCHGVRVLDPASGVQCPVRASRVHACLSRRPVSSVRCGSERPGVRRPVSSVQCGRPVSVRSRVRCVRPE
jgi:hypothetical protein